MGDTALRNQLFQRVIHYLTVSERKLALHSDPELLMSIKRKTECYFTENQRIIIRREFPLRPEDAWKTATGIADE